ncbi:Arginine utilization protein RocB [Seinonella peptonophila]|uniref:Arginine utilization protein RocB n=1 Tax=Seinonella peptonophila TaxID=112248 RepID=A0A1M4V574_9BACL|nr:M20/M25/M40 family metallo-hydrolase [Seinonella peptonophila]SHE64047.1 Arginine utilization protein RocB [Seinonella peptonophila]
MIDFYQEVYRLTRLLVEQPSIVGTVDEKNMAQLLHKTLQENPYFQENPNHLHLQPTIQDDRERYNVLALVKGRNPDNKGTILLLAHMDTVGVEDYGKWKRFAFSPDQLRSQWLESSAIPENVKDDILKDDWLGGRGILDMKCGIAVQIALINYFSAHRDQLDGNIMLVVTCDEENDHRGILSALKEIKRLAGKEQIHYIGAVNTDYISPRFLNDPSRYIYLGTVGKLLPTFFVVGKETHAGQLFEGFDPNLILSELTGRLNYNPDFCDVMDGEITLPPVSLKQTDLKKRYDVQTPQTAFAYFNFFVHSWSPKDVLERLKDVTTDAFAAAIEKYEQRYRHFCEVAQLPYQSQQIQPRVYTYHEFYQKCVEQYEGEFEESILRYSINLLNEEKLDVREYSLKMVEELWRWGGDGEPAIILFYSSPYIPRIVVDESEKKSKHLIEAVKRAVEKLQPQCEEPIQIRKFYPYLSDMSFVAISDTEFDIQHFEQNMPAWGRKYHYDVESIRELDVPVVNIGPYGKDAHKQWERVELNYSMQIVPNLVVQVMRELFASYQSKS